MTTIHLAAAPAAGHALPTHQQVVGAVQRAPREDRLKEQVLS